MLAGQGGCGRGQDASAGQPSGPRHDHRRYPHVVVVVEGSQCAQHEPRGLQVFVDVCLPPAQRARFSA